VDEIIDTTRYGDAFHAAFVIECYGNQDIKKAIYKSTIAAV
jgi:sugar/nucleoside kinase (ribokinase family)